MDANKGENSGAEVQMKMVVEFTRSMLVVSPQHCGYIFRP